MNMLAVAMGAFRQIRTAGTSFTAVIAIPNGNLMSPTKADGMTLKECRKAVVADLEKLGLLDHVEELNHAVGHCSRCKTTVEPLSTNNGS